MTLDDLYPFVVPYVPELPLPTVDHHIKAAAQDFFRRTHAWWEDLDTITTTDDTTDYDLASPVTSALIDKVLSVDVEGREYAKACELGDGVLTFHPDDTPAAGQNMDVRAALVPKIVITTTTTWRLPTKLDAYASDIAHGALASLYALIPGKAGEAAGKGLLFTNRVNVVGIKATRAYTRKRAGSSSAAQFF